MRTDLRFYLDREGGLPHIYRHDVTEEEVEAVLVSPIEDRVAKDGARMAIGKTESGRFLRVIYVPDDPPPGIFVVTAYEIRGKPLQALRRRMRRRGQR